MFTSKTPLIYLKLELRKDKRLQKSFHVSGLFLRDDVFPLEFSTFKITIIILYLLALYKFCWELRVNVSSPSFN